MAFCTNCGSQMDANAHFCTKCGKSVTSAATSPMAAAPTPAPAAPAQPAPAQTYTPQAVAPASGGSNVLKIVLIVVGVFVLLGVLSAAGLMYTAYRVRRAVRVSHDGRSGTVDFGGFKASTNNTSASELARKINVDIYPGASQSGDSTEAQFGNMTTASIKLTSSDSVPKVAAFYKARYPDAMISSEGDHKFSLVGGDKGGTLTITAEDMGGETRIEIVKVSGLKIETK